MIKIIYFTFLFLLLAENAFSAHLNLSCDSNGNLNEVNGLKLNKINLQKTRSPFEYDCQKLGTCLLDYAKLQSLNDDTVLVLERLLTSLKSMEESEISNRLMTLKEARFQCENVQKKVNPSRELIKLIYPFKGLNSNKSASNYDSKKIENIIELALSEGVDPLLALGILINENPPLVTKDIENKSTEYENLFGIIPIDGIALYDFMGCKILSKELIKNDSDIFTVYLKAQKLKTEFLNQKNEDFISQIYNKVLLRSNDVFNKLNLEMPPLQKCQNFELEEKFCEKNLKLMEKVFLYSELKRKSELLFMGLPIEKKEAFNCYFLEECKGMLKPGKQVKQISLIPQGTNDPGKATRYCNPMNSYLHGAIANLQENSGGIKQDGCCVDIVMGKNNSEAFIKSNIKTIVALDFIKSKIKSSKIDDLSLSIQKYNGLGCFGCTEKMVNKGSCFDALDMKKTPLYGARVADIIVNMLMKNSNIMEKIKSLSLKLNKPVKNIFCNQSGNIQVSDDYFLNLQRKFLLDNGADRAKMCSPYFK
jgi:hypothetical protein